MRSKWSLIFFTCSTHFTVANEEYRRHWKKESGYALQCGVGFKIRIVVHRIRRNKLKSGVSEQTVCDGTEIMS